MNNDHYNSELLILYAFEELPPRERVAVKEHIDRCEACAIEIKSIRKELETLSLLPIDEPSSASMRSVRSFAHKAVRKSLSRSLRELISPSAWQFQPIRVAVAASIVLVVCSFVMIQQFSNLRPQTASKPPILHWQDDYESSLSYLQTDQDRDVPQLISRDEPTVQSGYLASVGVRESEAEFHQKAREIDESIEFLLEQSTR